MLRITTQNSAEGVHLVLEGKLSGPWVPELARAFREAVSGGTPAVVDLSGLTGADAAGRDLLALILSGGGTLRNPSPLSRALLSRTAPLPARIKNNDRLGNEFQLD